MMLHNPMPLCPAPFLRIIFPMQTVRTMRRSQLPALPSSTVALISSAEMAVSHLHVSKFQGVPHGVDRSALQCNARLSGDPSNVDHPDAELGSVRNQYCSAEGNVSSTPIVSLCFA
jgi:hypothetical protein